eukprot:TRINITY_DN6353_c0_g1_i1.p1 TRINITY_DN6353_c0_g1~~TRINITY_DN6353_c0_g1_i1.p1  ORF type:complete len:146 (+),score=2.28 TRINITY_DN6353_c0_g1_i1:88-525(+)
MQNYTNDYFNQTNHLSNSNDNSYNYFLNNSNNHNHQSINTQINNHFLNPISNNSFIEINNYICYNCNDSLYQPGISFYISLNRIKKICFNCFSNLKCFQCQKQIKSEFLIFSITENNYLIHNDCKSDFIKVFILLKHSFHSFKII